MNLYSYCIPYDDGAAPNPYWDVCTLAICKPAIRRSAQVGDWIAGTGAKFSRLDRGRTKDMSGRLVYAMKVTSKMTMMEYDQYTRARLAKKIPAWRSTDSRRRLGDSIYDFSKEPPVQRRGVHKPENAATDLSGEHVLLSTHYYYFGGGAVLFPGDLRDIAQNRQGHRRKLNDRYVERFISWIEGLGHASRELVGNPQCDLFADSATCGWCAAGRAEEGDADDEYCGGGC